MTAKTIAKALGGRKVGIGWTAPCPAHDDRRPSLSIRDGAGTVLVRCHAGCSQRDVITALQASGLWGRSARRNELHRIKERAVAPPRAQPQLSERSDVAMAIWDVSIPAPGTLVDSYFKARGISDPPPPALRFHRGLKHPSGGSWPCMVALVTFGASGQPQAIHRTFLARDGVGKAPVDPGKMMLGPCRGGAVRLAGAADLLMVGEGIETCLAAMQATGHPAWAALSTSGLRALELPDDVRDVIVLADGDDPGEAAARDCALRWKRQGRRVRIAHPPRGLDFNDMLIGGSPQVEEGCDD